MSKIKKGDWVYVEADGEHVFQCDGNSIDGLLIGKEDLWFMEYCHRLEPVKPGDKLEIGDRVAVIGKSMKQDPKLGSIHRVIMFDHGDKNYPQIDFGKHGHFMRGSELARLPDCAQDKRPEPEDRKKETYWADDVLEETEVHSWFEPLTGLANCYYCGHERTIGLNDGDYPICESCATLSKDERKEVLKSRDDQPIPYVLTEECCQPSPDDSIWSDTVNPEQVSPCPLPKYDGSLWGYAEEAFRLIWDGCKFNAICTKPLSQKGESYFNDVDPVNLETEGFWDLIEYGGCVSEPIAKPKKNVSIGWDPYGLG